MLSGRTQRRVCPRHQSEENINLSKYFISSNGDRTHNQSVLQSHFVPLRNDWPQHLYFYICSYEKIFTVLAAFLRNLLPNSILYYRIILFYTIELARNRAICERIFLIFLKSHFVLSFYCINLSLPCFNVIVYIYIFMCIL